MNPLNHFIKREKLRPFRDTIGKNKDLKDSSIVTLWHGTTKENATKIMKEGLLPKRQINKLKLAEDPRYDKGTAKVTYGYHPITYLTGSSKTAALQAEIGPERELWKNRARGIYPGRDTKNPVVLKVTIPKDQIVQPDVESGRIIGTYAFTTNTPIPPQNIQIVDKEKARKKGIRRIMYRNNPVTEMPPLIDFSSQNALYQPSTNIYGEKSNRDFVSPVTGSRITISKGQGISLKHFPSVEDISYFYDTSPQAYSPTLIHLTPKSRVAAKLGPDTQATYQAAGDIVAVYPKRNNSLKYNATRKLLLHETGHKIENDYGLTGDYSTAGLKSEDSPSYYARSYLTKRGLPAEIRQKKAREEDIAEGFALWHKGVGTPHRDYVPNEKRISRFNLQYAPPATIDRLPITEKYPGHAFTIFDAEIGNLPIDTDKKNIEKIQRQQQREKFQKSMKDRMALFNNALGKEFKYDRWTPRAEYEEMESPEALVEDAEDEEARGFTTKKTSTEYAQDYTKIKEKGLLGKPYHLKEANIGQATDIEPYNEGVLIKTDNVSGDLALSDANEVSLFHGTTKENAERILKEGFNSEIGGRKLKRESDKVFLTPIKNVALLHANVGPEYKLKGKQVHEIDDQHPEDAAILKVTLPKSILLDKNNRVVNARENKELNTLLTKPDRYGAGKMFKEHIYEVRVNPQDIPIKSIKLEDIRKFKHRAYSESVHPEEVGVEYHGSVFRNPEETGIHRIDRTPINTNRQEILMTMIDSPIMDDNTGEDKRIEDPLLPRFPNNPHYKIKWYPIDEVLKKHAANDPGNIMNDNNLMGNRLPNAKKFIEERKYMTEDWPGGGIGGFEPTLMHKSGRIIDGRHRLRALKELGHDEVPIEEYDPDEPTTDTTGKSRAIQSKWYKPGRKFTRTGEQYLVRGSRIKDTRTPEEIDIDRMNELFRDDTSNNMAIRFGNKPKGMDPKAWEEYKGHLDAITHKDFTQGLIVGIDSTKKMNTIIDEDRELKRLNKVHPIFRASETPNYPVEGRRTFPTTKPIELTWQEKYNLEARNALKDQGYTDDDITEFLVERNRVKQNFSNLLWKQPGVQNIFSETKLPKGTPDINPEDLDELRKKYAEADAKSKRINIATVTKITPIKDDEESKDSQIYLTTKNVNKKYNLDWGKTPVDQVAMFVLPPYPDRIYMGKGMRDIDIKKPASIKAVASTLGHEELHNVLQKEIGGEASHKLDNITAPQEHYIDTNNVLGSGSSIQINYPSEHKKKMWLLSFVSDPKIRDKILKTSYDNPPGELMPIQDNTAENMAIKTNIPHWLLDKLPPEHHEEAKDLLLDKQWNTTQVGEKYGITNPYINILKRQPIRTTREEKIALLRQKAKELGRTPTIKDMKNTNATGAAYQKTFGTFNEAVRQAGLEPNEVHKIPQPLKELDLKTLPTEKEIQHNWYEKNVERLKPIRKQWIEENPEYQQEYYEENKEEKKQQYEENKEEILAQHKQYYEENKDKILTKKKGDYESNKEKYAARMKAYREKNRDKLIEYNRNYRKQQNAGDNNEVREE